jgi:uncharacterized membrane protein
MEGFSYSTDYIIVHNNLNNKPIIRIISPSKLDPMELRAQIVAEVIDFENDVAAVSFYYSKDNKSWTLIDTRQKPESENRYRTILDTNELTNGHYYLKVKATDLVGNIAELVDGTYEVTEGKTEKKEGTEGGFGDFMWILIIFIIVVIMILIIVLLLRRSKKREEELIEEVAAEAQMSKVMEGEIIPGGELPAALGGEGTGATPSSLQTYIPPQQGAQDQAQVPGQVPQAGLAPQPAAGAPQLPAYEADVETIDSYKQQMETWRAEGYNVSRLEQLALTDEDQFAHTFPEFSSNISRLQNISSRLNSMDTMGFEQEVNSIRSKLYEPDQAISTEGEFKTLEDKIMMRSTTGSSTTSPATLPDDDKVIDEMLPQLLPEDSSGEQTSQVPQDQVQPPVQESNTPPDVDIPPEMSDSTPTQTPAEQQQPDQQPKPEEKKDEDGSNQ